MADSRPEQRKDSRSAASLKVKYKSATVAEFIQQFGGDVSQGGIFIKTKSPLAPGALLKLELQLSDTSPVIAGVGRVVWRRASSEDASLPIGMGIKFIKLEPQSQQIVSQIVGARGSTSSRFELDSGAELARPSLTPDVEPAAPEPTAKRAAAAPAPAAAKPAPPAAPAQSPARASVAPVARVAPTAKQPSKPPSPIRSSTAIPAGLFARSPLAQAEPRAEPAREGRSSFFPPAPAAARPVAPAAAPSPRALRPQSPAAHAASHAAAASGPKGVFGGQAQHGQGSRPSISGQLRPAQEIADPGSGLFGDPMLKSSTAESNSTLGRRSRPDARVPSDPVPAVPEPPASHAPRARDEPNEPSYASSMFASINGKGKAEWEMQSHPPPAPNARAPWSTPPDADVDALLDEARFESLAHEVAPQTSEPEGEPLEDAVGVFAPGVPHPVSEESTDEDAELLDDLEGEDELLGGLEEEEAEHERAPITSTAPDAGPPMLLDLEGTDAAPRRGLSPAIVIAIVVGVLALGAGALYVQRGLLVQWGVLPSAATTTEQRVTAAPAKTPASVAPQVPEMEPKAAEPEPDRPAAVQQAEAQAQPAAQEAKPVAPTPTGPVELIKVNVTSAPRGAEVSVDGQSQGTTPTNVSLPIGREASVRVSMQGYTPLTRQVTATRDEPPLRFKLEPLPYELIVRSTPAGAEVNVGSVKTVSPAPLVLGHVVGDVSVSIAKPGYMRMTRPVRLDEFKQSENVLRAEIEVTLSPMPGSVPSATPVPQTQPRKPTRRRGGSSTQAEPAATAPSAEPSAPAPSATPATTTAPAPEAAAPKAEPTQAAPAADSTPSVPPAPAPPAPPELP